MWSCWSVSCMYRLDIIANENNPYDKIKQECVLILGETTITKNNDLNFFFFELFDVRICYCNHHSHKVIPITIETKRASEK